MRKVKSSPDDTAEGKFEKLTVLAAVVATKDEGHDAAFYREHIALANARHTVRLALKSKRVHK